MTERVFGPTGGRRRKRRLLAVSALIGAVFTIFFVAASSANLPNSSFDAGDGNLTVAGTETDWANAGINCTSTPKVAVLSTSRRAQVTTPSDRGHRRTTIRRQS